MANVRPKNGSKKYTTSVRIPKDIQVLNPEGLRKRNGEPKTHIEKALGTEDKKLALQRAHAFEKECDALFESIRRNAQANRQHTPHRQAVDHFSEGTKNISRIQQSSPELNARWIRDFVREKLELEKISPSDPRSLALFDLFADGIPDQILEKVVAKHASKAFDHENFDSLEEISRYKKKALDSRITVNEVFDRYIRKRIGDGPVKSSTISRAKATFEDFCEFLPFGKDTAAESISKAKVREWVGIYQRQHEEKNLTITTVKNKIESLSPAFKKAEDDDLIPKNPFRNFTAGLYLSNRGLKGNESNRSWINDELNDSALLHLINAASKKFKSHSRSPAHKIMMPLIGLALYTGARIEELCRLTPSDIKLRKHLGVRYIDITAAKSAAGIREIPLLPVAEQIIDALLAKASTGQDYLFPNLIEQDGRRSHKPSNEFSRFKKSLGYVQRNEYTFHSFRSTAITLLDRGSVSDSFISMMVGHIEGRSSLAKKRYSAGPQLAQLKDAVSVIKYGDEIDNLLIESLA